MSELETTVNVLIARVDALEEQNDSLIDRVDDLENLTFALENILNNMASSDNP